MNDPNLPAYGPGRSQKGTAALTEFNAEMKIDGKVTKLKFAKATADFGEPENTPLAPSPAIKTPTKTNASPAPSATPLMAMTTPPGASTPAPVVAMCRAMPSSCWKSPSR
jgi:hypothetical protein